MHATSALTYLRPDISFHAPDKLHFAPRQLPEVVAWPVSLVMRSLHSLSSEMLGTKRQKHSHLTSATDASFLGLQKPHFPLQAVRFKGLILRWLEQAAQVIVLLRYHLIDILDHHTSQHEPTITSQGNMQEVAMLTGSSV